MAEWIPIIAIVLGGGGLIGSIVMLLKIRPEAGQIVVTAAQGAVVVQAGVIDALQEENLGLRARARNQDARIQAQDARIAQQDQALWRQDRRIQQLERELHQLRNEIAGEHGDTEVFFPEEGGS